MSYSPPLTVIVPTGNSADVIEDCLRSVRWADEVLVVDSFSSDGSFDIASQYADRVLRHKYDFSAKQKNWIIPQAAHEWILLVDTDERVTVELREEVQRVLKDGPTAAGYRIPRINYVLGKPVYHTAYYPDYQIRLFRRDLARYEMRRVHAHIVLDGTCGTLQSSLIHYAHRSLNQTLGNLILRMTTWEAEERLQQTKAGDNPHPRWFWMQMLMRPLAAFGLRYFRRGGWRDGYRGLVISMIWAIYVAVTQMKMWESTLDLPERWWINDWQQNFADADSTGQSPWKQRV